MTLGHSGQGIPVHIVRSGGFYMVPENNASPIVVLCGGVSVGEEEAATPEPELEFHDEEFGKAFEHAFPEISLPHRRSVARMNAVALARLDPSVLSEGISTLIVEAQPDDYGALSVLPDLAQNQALAARGIGIDVRVARREGLR